MINKKYLWVLFGVMVAAQIFVPGQMIWSSEKTIEEGHLYKFKTAPVDPVDPFRGKYIRLRYEVENTMYEFDTTITLIENQNIYASIEEKGGYASVSDLSLQPPTGSGSYIKVVIRRMENGKAKISVPFDKYFMKESLAKPAEDLARELRNDSTSTIYAEVSVLDGNAVLRNVMIDDQSIADLVRAK